MPIIHRKIPTLISQGYACDFCDKPIKIDYEAYNANRDLRPMRDFFTETPFELNYFGKEFIFHQDCIEKALPKLSTAEA